MPKAIGLFWLQFRVLVWKNWIINSKNPFLFVLRCFLLPVAYGVFLSLAQFMLHRLNNYNPGSPTVIPTLKDHFDGKTSLYILDGTNHSSSDLPSPLQIMNRTFQGFTIEQQQSVNVLNDASEITKKCPQNFNGFSGCYAVVVFTDMNPVGETPHGINYTIFTDAGLTRIDIEKHTSDVETRILPLQWAIDQSIIELQTNVPQQTPLEWGYSNQTNAQQATAIRLSYDRGIREIIGLAFFLTFTGIVYQISGSVANERALLITEHMKVMGLYDSARILSWHVGTSLTYFPGWVAVAILWKLRIFVETGVGLIVLVHALLGFVLASWSFIVAVPFSESPQLAAVVATFLSLVFAIFGMVANTQNTTVTLLLSVVFPPSFYIFALKAICGFENHQLPTNPLIGDPDTGIQLAPLIFVAIIDIILWPFLAVFLERYLYSNATVSSQMKESLVDDFSTSTMPANTAISIRHLSKIYSSPWFSSSDDVTAVQDLNLDIPKTGIFVMLGSNGAGKSTSLSIMAGLSSITSGRVIFEGGYSRPPRGVLGIVPQKNVLFPELTCMQTLRVWRAVKWSSSRYETDEDLEQLLRDCDLEKKIHANANTLSGGQKRKLQLAIGLLGGSKIVLVDECTSGVDPLSRRALWKTLSAFRSDRCIVFTTHFLDEADLLADQIAILAAPGKVVASGSPVSLKSTLGEGYSVQVTFGSILGGSEAEKLYGYSTSSYELFSVIRMIVPDAYVTKSSPSLVVYHLNTRDSHVVGQVLDLLEETEQQGRIKSYDILGTTIEDIFLDLMNKEKSAGKKHVKTHSASSSLDNLSSTSLVQPMPIMDLPNGKGVSPYRQAFTIFHKRMLIVRRAWLTPLLTIIIAVTGSTVPLTFTSGLQQLCVPAAASLSAVPLWLPDAPFAKSNASQNVFPRMVVSPPSLLDSFGNLTKNLLVTKTADERAFTVAVNNGHGIFSLGGVSVDQVNGATTVAWESSPPGIRAPAMLNMASNVLLHRALRLSTNPPSSDPDKGLIMIATNFGAFAKVASSTLMYLRWIFFFGAVMAVYPAFFSLYVAKERRSDVQAMQLSNGLTNPVGLWLGHLMFDTITSIILSTIIIIIFAAVSSQFHGLGLLWIVFVLYGITAALFSYALSLMVSSPLAAFAIVAGYQFIMLVIYISSYLIIFTFGKVETTGKLTTIVHFTTSFLAPVDNVVRATLVSVNLFSLLCEGTDIVSTASLFGIKRFGGPILYLLVHSFVLLGVLVWVDSGHRYPRPLSPKKALEHRHLVSTSSVTLNQDINHTEVEHSDDTSLLRVVGVSKTFNEKQVTDDVNLNIPRDTIFALLGPNGAGKTTTFNIIRGDVVPDTGDVFIDGASIVTNPRRARMSLGVCPQFTAIDDQLTVREHLIIYGRLKGLDRGPQLNSSIDAVLEGTSLTMYADRLASKLSGGNQRKLSLAIALLGNPPVILIDEFSTGVDPKMKRDMWQTLRRVAVGKAIVITTHSMEEASALATNVGILSKRMLAIGTTASLSARYGTYEVQFVCRTRAEVIKARSLMQHIPGSRMADDVATRFEVPIDGAYSLARLFNTLSEHGDFMEYTVERGSLESVFLKVIKENNLREEGQDQPIVPPRTAPYAYDSMWRNY